VQIEWLEPISCIVHAPILHRAGGLRFGYDDGKNPGGILVREKGAGSLSGSPATSIVIPAYNESARISSTLREVVTCIRSRGWDAEVIVVNDGSVDTTARQALDYSLSAPEVRLVENPGHRGKGFAVRHGMLQARGETILFTDADLCVPIGEAERLFAAIREGADIAIGSRWSSGYPLPVTRMRRQPLHRHAFGRSFNWILRAGMGLKFHDTQCGFKAFSREAVQTVFPLQTIEGWGFDPEILFIAIKRHLRIVEVPVTWDRDERDPLAYLRDGFQVLQEVAAVRRNAMLGRYNMPAQPARRPPA
jgi:dolichyl-phosphate beta-glucosyltransferase